LLPAACCRAAEAVATVGGDTIEAGEVTGLYQAAVRGQPVNPAAAAVLQAQVLEELVARRLMLAYARRSGDAPSPAEIEQEFTRLRTRLQSEGKTLEDYLRAQSATEAEVRRQLAWNLVWEKYIARYVTNARLEAYFQAHARDFDGTQVSVSHILWKLEPNPSAERTGGLVAQAEAVREEILSGRLSFAQAAKKYSAGPSAREGGKLGLIPRHGVMDEAFSRAAFALAPGEVSQPVVTPFGVHLIRCDAIQAGTKKWTDVRKPLEEALARELLEKLAALERKQTPVKYTGPWPHFDPATRQLVVPGS